MKDEKARSIKYYLLKEAGFNSREANQLKDYSWEKVNYFIDTNLKYREYLQQQIRLRGKKDGNKEKS
jgi:hypothetical protein